MSAVTATGVDTHSHESGRTHLMECKRVLAGIAIGLLLTAPASAQQPARTPAGSPASTSVATGPGNPLPIVGVMLDHEEELGLSSSQVDGLERLGLDVLRETIRRRADLMIAGLDLWALVDREPNEEIDTATVEVKIREAERIRADFQLAFVRAIEAAKSQLTPDQRSKLSTLVRNQEAGEADPPDPRGQAAAARSARGGGGHPPPSGGSGGRPPRVDSHRGPHGHVFIGIGPLWWGPPYPYWGYPEWVYVPPPVTVEPPAYIEQPPTAPPAYWYYCPSAGAYYPSVQTCPDPWVRVAPRAG
jgi:hypothetical protein